MSVRKHGRRWGIWVYDPSIKRNRYIGSEPGTQEGRRNAKVRDAEARERLGRSKQTRETADKFAHRWVDDYPRASERTKKHNRERLVRFAAGGVT